jgi:hypothetical protein
MTGRTLCDSRRGECRCLGERWRTGALKGPVAPAAMLVPVTPPRTTTTPRSQRLGTRTRLSRTSTVAR